jgi:hypothetical protein
VSNLIDLGYVVEKTESTITTGLHFDPVRLACTNGTHSQQC